MAVIDAPILKILSDLDIDLMDIEGDQDYLRALMEAVNTLSLDSLNKPGKEDPRIPILQEEIRRVRADRKAAAPSPAMKKVSVDKLMGRKAQSAPKIEPQKLLPGTSDSDGEKNVDTDGLSSRLNNISESLNGLGKVLRQQLGLDKAEVKGQRKINDRENKRRREEEVEKQKQTKKGSASEGKVASAVKAPFVGLFGTIKKFFGNIVAGSVVLGFVKWMQGLDQSQFENFIKTLQDNAHWILGGIIAIAALPIVSTLVGFTSVLIGGIALLVPLLPVLLKTLAVVAVVAAAIIAGKFLWDKGKKAWKWLGERISGGEASYEMDKKLDQKLRDAGMDKSGRRLGLSTREKKFGTTTPGGRNEEQEKIFQEVQAERRRINALEKERNAQIGPIEKEIANLLQQREFYTGTSVRNRKLNEAGKARKSQLQSRRQSIIERYDTLIRSGGFAAANKITSANLGNNNVIPRNIDSPLSGNNNTTLIESGTQGDNQQVASGVSGGEETPSFSNRSGRLGNQFTLGASNGD